MLIKSNWSNGHGHMVCMHLYIYGTTSNMCIMSYENIMIYEFDNCPLSIPVASPPSPKKQYWNWFCVAAATTVYDGCRRCCCYCYFISVVRWCFGFCFLFNVLCIRPEVITAKCKQNWLNVYNSNTKHERLCAEMKSGWISAYTIHAIQCLMMKIVFESNCSTVDIKILASKSNFSKFEFSNAQR